MADMRGPRRLSRELDVDALTLEQRREIMSLRATERGICAAQEWLDVLARTLQMDTARLQKRYGGTAGLQRLYNAHRTGRNMNAVDYAP